LRTITIRNLPVELRERLEAEAKREGASLAQTVIRLLLQATGLSRSPNRRARHHDLDELAGTWGAEETAEFDEALAAQRRIDPDVWR
jgi:hypothetical protein